MNPTESVNAVGTTAGFINSEGPVAVIIAVFILIFILSQYMQWKQNKDFKKSADVNAETMLKSILEQQKSLIENMRAEKEHENRDEKDLMDIFIKINNRLREDCKDALEVLDADRTAIYAFHNGSQSTHGLPFFKFSCVCEYIQRGSGSKSKMKVHNSIPINLLDEVIEKLWRDGHYEYFSSEMEDGNNFINKLLLQDDNKTCILYTIYDMESRPIGFILSEFGEENFSQEQLKEKKKYLKYLGDKVSPVLEFSNYHRNSKAKAGMF